MTRNRKPNQGSLLNYLALLKCKSFAFFLVINGQDMKFMKLNTHTHICTSSSFTYFFSDKILAKVVQISNGANISEDATLPNSLQGTTRRKVLLNKGSSANRGLSKSIQFEGHLRQLNREIT